MLAMQLSITKCQSRELIMNSTVIILSLFCTFKTFSKFLSHLRIRGRLNGEFFSSAIKFFCKQVEHAPDHVRREHQHEVIARRY